eukprot:1159611-Pelagomonas_calceolata.AAC.10
MSENKGLEAPEGRHPVGMAAAEGGSLCIFEKQLIPKSARDCAYLAGLCCWYSLCGWTSWAFEQQLPKRVWNCVPCRPPHAGAV